MVAWRDEQAIAGLRAICLALPFAEEFETWGHPTFRVRGKIFAICDVGDGNGTLNMSAKAMPAAQDALVRSHADCFVPPYVGRSGWVGIRLHQATDWELVTSLVVEAHAATLGGGKRGRAERTLTPTHAGGRGLAVPLTGRLKRG